jgi:hypothetical protein
MTLQVSHSEFAAEFAPTTPPALLVYAARCWRAARDRGEQPQPRLADMLAAHDCTMLAPVLDSLCLFYEAALGRPMATGATLALSDDERHLLGLIDASAPRACAACPEGAATPLDCAICSTRIMLALSFAGPNPATLQ